MVVEKYGKCTTISEWSNKACLSNTSRGELGTNVQVFRTFNFAATDVTFTYFEGKIHFRFEHQPAADYLLDTMFLLKILQSQSRNDGCWFFKEKLSAYQEYLWGFLEAARIEGLVRRHKISNSANWMVIKTASIETERPIHIVEPKSQLLDHTQLENHAPTKCTNKWLDLISLNKTRTRKNCIRSYWNF